MFEDDVAIDAEQTPGKISTHGFNSLLSTTLTDLDSDSLSVPIISGSQVQALA